MAILRTTVKWGRTQPATRRGSSLTATEKANVARALAYLRVRHGGGRAVAELLGFDANTVSRATSPKRIVTPALAFAAARLAAVGVDDVLTGAWPKLCPTCGQVTP